jgi:type I site-specific restriction endonuclease
MNKKDLSERDICTKYITPALEAAGWDIQTQIREEFALTNGRIIVRGKLHTRGKNKRADCMKISNQLKNIQAELKTELIKALENH